MKQKDKTSAKYHWGYSRLCAIEASWGSSMINYDWEPLKTGIRDDDESHSDAENERKGSSN
jgi:hypothetical protein